MKTYIVDGQTVRAETERHAVKYYYCVFNRLPDTVEDEGGNEREVYGLCENTSLGIFCGDENGKVYECDSEGVTWLTDSELEKLSIH